VESLFTRKDWDRLPEGYPAQLIDGCLVKQPAPTYGHQRVQTHLIALLLEHVDKRLVLAAPADVLVDEINVFQPDIVVLRSPPKLTESYVGVPLVAFEIYSPSSRERDRGFKTRRLLGRGVREVWLIDPDEETIEVVDVDRSRLHRADDVATSYAVRGFEITPDELFGESA
jgi:Uma2 family endonuclease